MISFEHLYRYLKNQNLSFLKFTRIKLSKNFEIEDIFDDNFK
jgi:hypothetical protein